MIATISACVIALWPQLFGLQNTWIAGHIVALRGPAIVAALLAVLLLSLLRFIRPIRNLTGSMAFVLVLFAVASGGILALRGLTGIALDPSVGDSRLTVLEWNTRGEEVPASTIASLALESGADIIALPETTSGLGESVAVKMREAGSPMWVNTVSFDEVYKARSTTILISPRLGDYTVTSYTGSGPPLNTNTVPTVVAVPVSGEGPTIVAVHAVAPVRWELRNWKSDLDWLAQQCQSEDVIMVGDFNATLDNFAGRGIDGGDLGRCRDAAAAARGAGLGTWPTAIPAVLGAPIDHVMATPNWRVTAFEVREKFDRAGSDHRPIVAQLELRE